MPAKGKIAHHKSHPPAGWLFFMAGKTPGKRVDVKMHTNAVSRTIIIANGQLSRSTDLRQRIGSGDRIICADGGAHHARRMGLTPDVVVGDLDSLDPGLRAELEAAGVRFEVHPAHKDQTDLELALQLAMAEGATHIEIWAMLGGRLDQTMANLLLLTRPEWHAAQVRMVEGNQMVWPLRGGQETTIHGVAGDVLSLIPLSPLVFGVTLEGVEWPLQAATLHFGSTLTVSNQLTAPVARLGVENGLLLVIHQSSAVQEDIP
jgi:thiamine pyrophosphokinase